MDCGVGRRRDTHLPEGRGQDLPQEHPRQGWTRSVAGVRSAQVGDLEMTVGSSLRTQGVKEGLYELALPIREELRAVEAPEKMRAS